VYYSEPVYLDENQQYRREYTRPSRQVELAGFSLTVFGPLWNLKHKETYFGIDATEHLIA